MQWFSSLIRHPQTKIIASLAGLYIALVLAMYFLVPDFGFGVDLRTFFRPAGQAFFRGEDPFAVREGIFSPPWVYLILAPFILLPEYLAYCAFLMASLFLFAYAAYRFDATRLTMILFLTAPPVGYCLIVGNIDALVILGLLLPPQIGLFFVSLKPQVGFFVILFWLVESYRNDGWKETLRVFAPITIVTLITFALYGLWPLRMLEPQPYETINASMWPYSIPIALGLAAASLKEREIKFAIVASPLFAPFINFLSYAASLLTVLSSNFYTVVVIIGLWMLAFMDGRVIELF